MNLVDVVAAYLDEIRRLIDSPTTNEESYYSALRSLFSGFLKARNLPFDVRTGTGERRRGGGTDKPDVAFYDSSGDFLVVASEVKHPNIELSDLAVSTEQNDQIGRYLAQTNAVLLINLRSIGLLTVYPPY